MSTLVGFEHLVDSTTTIFLQELQRRFADKHTVCDFGRWLQFYSFDVIGELTFSKRLGFIEHGVDVEGIIASNDSFLDYANVIGQLPVLDRLLLKNPIRLWASKLGFGSSETPVVSFAKSRITERLEQSKLGFNNLDPADKHPNSSDFLSRFLTVSATQPEFMHPGRVLGLTAANVFAGSDTTAITLRTIFYHLLQDETIMDKLMAELKVLQSLDESTGGMALPKWKDVYELPYLSAVVKEALRIHPAVGMTLERVVPSGGLTLDGTTLPKGTIVGCNAWTIHRDQTVFGAHPERFSPERWLNASAEQRASMERHLLSFGAGARTCIGKNISFLEIYKLVPAILQRFELQLAHPETPWRLHNAFFVKQEEFYVHIRQRINP